MKRLIAFFVKQSVFSNLLTVAVLLIGMVTVFLIRREVFPNVNFDIVTISTIFPGASPEEVETLVTNPLEQDTKEIDGVKRMLSGSLDNRSEIVIFLDPDQTTEDQGKSDVQDVVDRFTDLPEGADKPIVTAVQSKLSPIIEVSVAGDIDPLELRRISKSLEDEIEDISGVARVAHRGLRDVEIKVEPDLKKLSRYRLSLEDVISALKRQNRSIPGGTLEVLPQANVKEKIVRTIGEFQTLDDVKQTVIRANEIGQSIHVSDVATVYYDLEKASILNRTNGAPSLSLTVLKKEKADAIKVVDQIKEVVDRFQKKLSKQDNVSFSFINDLSQYIRRRLSVLIGNLAIGLALVLFILPLTMPFRFSLMIALGIPFGFLGTMILLYNTGHSINLISMLGLIIVAGILVDDAIVVTENASRLIEEGLSPQEAAIQGTHQMLGPVTASVLTTVFAFLPMAFMSGIFGKFVKEIPIAVVTALFVSLFEAFFILPAHIAHWFKAQDVIKKPKKKNILVRSSEKSMQFWEQKVVPIYSKWLKFTLNHRYYVLFALFILFVGSMTLATKGMRFILFPPEGVEIFFVRTEAPTGTSLDRHVLLLKPIEQLLKTLPKSEVENFVTAIGIQQQDPNDPNTKRGTEYAQVTVYLTPEKNRNRTAAQIIEDLRSRLAKIDGLSKVTFQRVNPGPPSGKPISIGVRGKDYKDILPAVEELKSALLKMKGTTDISDSYIPGKEELRITVHSKEAAAAGLSVETVGNTVRAAFEGIIATSVRKLDEEQDVRVSLQKSDRGTQETIGDLMIPNAQGNLIKLSQVAHITKGQGLSLYEHEGNQRQVKVVGEVDTKITSATEVNNQVREILPELRKKYPLVTVDFGGEDEDTQESMASLFRAFGVAIIGIFLILVMTFQNLIQPLLVLITVPLGVIAVIWAFFLHGMPLSFMGMLGIVALAGVIVNNAIVYVDFVNQRRSEGADFRESIEEAAKMRIKPIFLTTMTTIAGVLPTAYGIGGLDKFVVPIAMALGWGLLFGSILTAFVFPSALAILDDVSLFWSTKIKRQEKSA